MRASARNRILDLFNEQHRQHRQDIYPYDNVNKVCIAGQFIKQSRVRVLNGRNLVDIDTGEQQAEIGGVGANSCKARVLHHHVIKSLVQYWRPLNAISSV